MQSCRQPDIEYCLNDSCNHLNILYNNVALYIHLNTCKCMQTMQSCHTFLHSRDFQLLKFPLIFQSAADIVQLNVKGCMQTPINTCLCYLSTTDTLNTILRANSNNASYRDVDKRVFASRYVPR